MIETVKKVEFQLRDGTLVEVEMTSELLRKIRENYSLETDDEVSEKLVKYYLVGAISNAMKQTGSGDVEIPS